MGVTGAAQQAGQKKSQGLSDPFIVAAQKSLVNKTNSVLGQLQKFASSAKVLQKEDLIKLFYEIYNEATEIPADQMEGGAETTFVRGEQV